MNALGVAALGAIVAVVGTGAHRAFAPWGLVGAIAFVVAAGVFARAWQAWWGFGVYACAWGVMTMVLAQMGPNGSVLIAGDGLGYGWLGGATAAIVVVAFAPRRWWEGSDVTA